MIWNKSRPWWRTYRFALMMPRRKIGSGNGPGNGAKGGENSVQVATLVDRINRLEETLRTVRLENERLKGA